MSGQSANLTLKEACAMQHRIQASGSQAGPSKGSDVKGESYSSGSSKKSKKPMKAMEHSEKSEQGHEY